MKIPHYLQTDYANVPYGSSNIAACGCGPTSFAMVASYLTGTTITPADAVAWCGNSYYVCTVALVLSLDYWGDFDKMRISQDRPKTDIGQRDLYRF